MLKQQTTNQPPEDAAQTSRRDVWEVSLPKGGGAISGLGENLSTDSFTGTARMVIPLPISPCRGSEPALSVEYESGAGNGLFGMGWGLRFPHIKRKHSDGTTQYDETDTYTIVGGTDLVRMDAEPSKRSLPGGRETYRVIRYAPMKEEDFALIELWEPLLRAEGAPFWKITSADHTITIYGRSAQARVSDPEDPGRIFLWLPEEVYTPTGEHQLIFYTGDGANRIPELIRYGNADPCADSMLLDSHPARKVPDLWRFELVFDYGNYDIDPANADPYAPKGDIPIRPDRFSTYEAGFEIATRFRCENVLMFHRFKELGERPRLVSATVLTYETNTVGLSLLARVARRGYQFDSAAGRYTTAETPPVTFGYTEFAPTAQSFKPLQGLGESTRFTLLDFNAEGIPGALYNDGSTLLYRAPHSETSSHSGAPVPINVASNRVHYGALENLGDFPILRPDVKGKRAVLTDISGDGRPDLVSSSGLWERDEKNGWMPFRPFGSLPSDFDAPGQKLADMTGNGRADLVRVSKEGTRVYTCIGANGFNPPQHWPVPTDVPSTLESTPERYVGFSDMDGSGRAHLVRIKSGSVCYWPSLGYGRLGELVKMENAPSFGPGFDTRRLHLADLDGSGATDLIYFDAHEARVYLNRAGVGFCDPITLPLPFPYNSLDQILFADVYGGGNSCLVITKPHNAAGPIHLCYDFCGGKKPYLLHTIDNHMGAKTTVTYSASTRFYMADKAAGLEWATTLPFPVQVVSEVVHEDALSGSRFQSRYSYHHGFYDGVKRVFRGFGRVDRQESEYFPLSKHLEEEGCYTAPKLMRTWYHTGAFLSDAELRSIYAKEQYTGDLKAYALCENVIEWGGHSPEGLTLRDLYAAFAGSELRSEVYGLDDSDQAIHPYSVSERSYTVRLLQPRFSGRLSICDIHPRESLTHTYERDPKDPLITHSMMLETDRFGYVERSCKITYPRRGETPFPGQKETKIICVVNRVAHHTAPERYALGVQYEERFYTIADLEPKTERFGFEEIREVLAKRMPAWDAKEFSTDEALLSTWERAYYAEVSETGVSQLPLGVFSLPLLPSARHEAVFTPKEIGEVFAEAMSKTELGKMIEEGGYRLEEGCYWNVNARTEYLGAEGFYQPQKTVDYRENAVMYGYDPHGLILTQTTDPLGNVTRTEAIDYARLIPKRLIDINDNISEIETDPLGRVVRTSFYGTEEGKKVGFAPLDQVPMEAPETLEALLAQPERYLGGCQSYFYYDPFSWKERGIAVHTAVLSAERYPDDSAVRIQIALEYKNGFRRTAQTKTLAEPGEAYAIDSYTGELNVKICKRRWLTSGAKVFDNKGNPVKTYAPYYAESPLFTSHATLDRFEYATTTYYDALNRPMQVLSPKGFLTQTHRSPWEKRVYDANDTLSESPYYRDNIQKVRRDSLWFDSDLDDIGRKQLESIASLCKDTPTTSVFDNAGNQLAEQLCNRTDVNQKVETLQTRHRYDFAGRRIESADPRLFQSGHANFRYHYSRFGVLLVTESADAGKRRTLADIHGNPIFSMDGRGVRTYIKYDALYRKRATVVFTEDSDMPCTRERVLYGEEAHENPKAHNLRGQPFILYDPAGEIQISGYSIGAQPLALTRRFCRSYTGSPDWDHIDPSLLGKEKFTQSYRYDALGRITEETDSDDNRITPRYHISGKLSAISLLCADQTTPMETVNAITYTAKGGCEQLQTANGVTTRYRYDPKNSSLCEITSRKSGNLLQSLRYTYDPAGNILTQSDDALERVYHGNAEISPLSVYTYDALYQLTRATGRRKKGGMEKDVPHPNDKMALESYIERYSYDNAGNRTSIRHQSPSENHTIDIILSTRSNHAVRADIRGHAAVIQPEEVDKFFDANGNQTDIGKQHPLRWDEQNQLQNAVLITRESGKNDTEYYHYDAEGKRVRKVLQTYGENGQSVTLREVLYLGNLEIRRTLKGNDPATTKTIQESRHLRLMDDERCFATFVRWINTPPSGLAPVSATYHLHDLLDSCTVQTDAKGNIICREEFSPYGQTLLFAATGSAAALKCYRYADAERDVSGLYHYGARYYDPATGRWLSPDPAGTVDGLNLYTFVGGNPTSYEDREGTGKFLIAIVKNAAQKNKRYCSGAMIGARSFSTIQPPPWPLSENQMEDTHAPRYGPSFSTFSSTVSERPQSGPLYGHGLIKETFDSSTLQNRPILTTAPMEVDTVIPLPLDQMDDKRASIMGKIVPIEAQETPLGVLQAGVLDNAINLTNAITIDLLKQLFSGDWGGPVSDVFRGDFERISALLSELNAGDDPTIIQLLVYREVHGKWQIEEWKLPAEIEKKLLDAHRAQIAQERKQIEAAQKRKTK